MTKLFLFVAAAALALAQTAPQPLRELPYTPSLDVTSMDRAVDPCTDFFKYSCGNWLRKNPIPPDQSSWDVYTKLHDENLRYLWGVLEETAKKTAGRTPAEQKIGDYFQACMAEPAVEQAGFQPLEPTLRAIAAMKTKADLAAVLADLQRTQPGAGPLFGFTSGQDFADATRVIAFLWAGGLGLPDRDYYVVDSPKNRDLRAGYVAHIARIFELLGDTPDAARQQAATVMAMETALAKVSLTRVEKRDPYKLAHKMPPAALAALTPAFHWNVYFKRVAAPAFTDINVTEPAFFRQVETLLATRSLADWKTYLRWHATHARAPYLSSPFVDSSFEFFGKQLRGLKQLSPRWKRCVQYVDHDLGEALGKVFVDRTFGPTTKDEALAMTREVEKAMEQDLQTLTWMSDTTKKQALNKLHAMVNKIGYPNRWRDYSALEVRPDGFLANVERASTFEMHRQLDKIGRPLDRQEWSMTPPTVNAYYDAQMNDMNFPAGVLQPPLFDTRLDDAPNYGNTGATIGHELTHGFDDEGRQFDAQGNLKDWWTKDDAKRFNERTDCVMKQYAGYTIVDDIKINSKLTLGEDVADLGGTLLAYIAWKNATKDDRLENVDGLTPDQRFFVGMAQWACGDQRPESRRLSAVTNPHSPNEFRINGVVANMPEFQQAFGCKVGQPMVRRPACRVW